MSLEMFFGGIRREKNVIADKKNAGSPREFRSKITGCTLLFFRNLEIRNFRFPISLFHDFFCINVRSVAYHNRLQTVCDGLIFDVFQAAPKNPRAPVSGNYD